MERMYRVVSLFSGCGGLDLGFKGGFRFLHQNFEENKFEIVWANDIMKEAVETYKYNLGEHIVIGDISEILKEDHLIPDCDVVIGGFPCQDFSVAGRRRGLNSERGMLYRKMKSVIELREPLVFVAENVKGLTNLGNALRIIIDDFNKVGIGYKIHHQVLNAADYGVPQKRERLFIVGVRQDLDVDYVFPTPTHSKKLSLECSLPWVTAREAIEDLWGLERTPESPPNHDQISMARNYGTHCQGNRPINPNEPAPTIRAEHHGNIEFHYYGTRRLSVRECCRIQSFPDDFIIMGSTTAAYKQVGNAVPPVLAWHIARSVQSLLDSVKKCLVMKA